MAANARAEIVHATCVAIGTSGVLIRGLSGAGKSDLALRLLKTPLPDEYGRVRLVGDDQVHLAVEGETIVASAVDILAGQLEVRGLGIVPVASVGSVTVRLVVDAVPRDAVVRLPEADDRMTCLLSVNIPRVALEVLDASCVAKVLVALDLVNGTH